MQVCDNCHQPAEQLRSIDGGPRLCGGCESSAKRAAAEAELEPIRRQRAAELEQTQEYSRLAAMRPDPPEAFCTYGQCAGTTNPAVGVRSGHLCCEHCLRVELPGHEPALIVVLERKVAALEAALAAPQATPKAARKTAGQ